MSKAPIGSMVKIVTETREGSAAGSLIFVVSHCQCGCQGYICSDRHTYYPKEVKAFKRKLV